jgi:hypothetical protein
VLLGDNYMCCLDRDALFGHCGSIGAVQYFIFPAVSAFIAKTS